MTRVEKRAIRKEICWLLDDQLKNPSHDHSKRLRELGDLIKSDEKGPVTPFKTGDWDQDELDYLIGHVPVVGFEITAYRLNRTVRSAQSKYYREIKKNRHLAG